MGNTSWALNGIANKSAFIVLTGIVTLSSGAIGLAWLFYKRVNRATHFDASTAQFYNIEELHSAIDDLRKEIEELKANKVLLQKSCGSSVTDLSSKPPKSVRFKRTLSVLSSSDTEVTEFQSAWSGDDSGDEFFDFFENNENTEESTGEEESGAAEEEALQIFEKVDALLEGSSEEQESAFQLLSNYEDEYSHNVEYLWRMAKCYQMTALCSTDDKLKKDRTFTAVEYGKRALAADNNNAEAHKWMAISLGSTVEYLGVSEKIQNGFVFKEHIDFAISINPTDPLLHHLLGRFCYELSLLSWIERKVATTLFSVMPTGSIEEALEHFQECEKLRVGPWKENRVFLARCCIQQKKYSEAIHWIDEAIPIEISSPEDENYQNELTKLQHKYAGYRST